MGYIINGLVQGIKESAFFSIMMILFWFVLLVVSLGGLFFGAVLTLFGSGLGPILFIIGIGAFLFGFFSFFLVGSLR